MAGTEHMKSDKSKSEPPFNTMNRKRILQVQDFNPQLICSLCNGYFIDATTIIECLHSFCRACIVHYLKTNRFCPVCEVQIHKSNPLLNIREDATLQALVYKLVPGLFQREMRLRKEFSEQHPEAPQTKMEDANNMCIYTPDEYFSLTLEHWSPNKNFNCDAKESTVESVDQKDTERIEEPAESPSGNGKRYLRCPAAVTIGHIHKLLRAKHGLDPVHLVEILFKDELLPEYLTLVDVAYIYKWKRKGPISLSYRMYANSCKKIKPDASATAGVDSRLPSSDPCLAEATDPVIKSLGDETQSTDKTTNWQEVQLQISETGIMSVSGISLEHNNNLSTPDNIFDNQAKSKGKNHTEALDPVLGLPKYLTLVDSFCDKIVTKHQELSLVEPKQTPGSATSTHEAAQPGVNSESATGFSENKPAPTPSNQQMSVDAESKKSCPKGKPKANIQNFSEPVDESKGTNVCTPLQQDTQNAKRQKLSDVPKLPKEIIKQASESFIPKESSKSNQLHNKGTKQDLLYHVPTSSTSSSTTQKYHPTVVAKHCDTKNMLSSSSSVVPAVSPQAAKKDSNQATMSYNTRKDSPKNWNPSFSKASYPIVKNKPPVSGVNVNNNTELKTEKAPKFFKMRNMPRYLGNPASGVKPMYQLSDNSKTSQAESPTRTKNVVMKIDPKTLSPIVCVTTSDSLPSGSDGQHKSEYKSSQPSCSQKSSSEGTNCSTSVSTSELDGSKKPLLDKSKLAVESHAMSSSSHTQATTTSTALTNSKSSLTCASGVSFKMSHSRSISASSRSSHHHEFCNDAPSQRSHGGSVLETASPVLASPKFGSVPTFSLNPATLNLLSSNLSFLPNASNFLYGNFADFGSPLVRPGLNRSGCLGVMPSGSNSGTNNVGPSVCASGLPAGMGAYHSMPPSINMLFPHHRSNERDRSGSTHAQVHTPAVQRIPASKGTAPTSGHKQNTAKKNLLGGNKPSQAQTTNSLKNVKSDDDNESVSVSSTKSELLGTSSQTQRTDKQATNLNNNSIICPKNADKIENNKSSVTVKEISKQKDGVMMPNVELDSSICVATSDTHHGSEIIARKELRAKEDVEKEAKEKHMPLTDLSIKIKTGDKHRNLSNEINDNNNKKMKFSSLCVENSSPVLTPDVISKPCTDPR